MAAGAWQQLCTPDLRYSIQALFESRIKESAVHRRGRRKGESVKTKTIALGSAALVALLVIGCAQVPQAELDAAKAILAEAEGAAAETYAADQLNAAREALQAVELEVEAQGAKFVLTRSYDKTKELITDLSQKATAAKDTAIATKEQYKAESEAALASIKTTIESIGTMLTDLAACRPQPKGFANDLAMLGGTRDGLASEIASVEQALANEDYMGGRTMALGLQERAQALLTDLESAKSKAHC